MGMSNQTEEKELFHAVSLSGGKDSTAMLLLMIERGLPIDAVLTADTGMEFPEMYEHLQKLDDYLFAERGLHLTWLRHPKGFEWLMFEEKKQRPASIENRQRLGVALYGNGWPGPRVRWCTGQLKTHLIHKEINRLKGQYKAVSYVGIAADEPKRIKNERYPLMAQAIYAEDEMQIILMLWGLPWGSMNLAESNRLTVISYLIQNAVVRANRYLEALREHRYLGNSSILEKEAFTQLVSAFFEAKRNGQTECSLVKITCGEAKYLEAAEVLGKKLRQTDYVGMLDGGLYVLLSDTEEKNALCVITRFAEAGYERTIANGEVAA